MKSCFLALALAAAAAAQTVSIGAPAPGSTIVRGTNITIEIDKPATLTGSQDVALAIGLQSCASSAGCALDASQVLGEILYAGPYAPARDPAHASRPPAQNFSVLVPASFPQGPAAITVAHFVLVGAGPFADVDAHNVSVTVE